MADPDSVEGWLRLAARHEGAAKRLCDDKDLAAEGHWHAGMAVECVLKAKIMRKEGLNSWPDKDLRDELWTHDLNALRKIAVLPLTPKSAIAAAWHTVLQYNRSQGYDPKRMPRVVARSMVEAAFGPDGVVTWIRQTLK